MSSYVTDKQAVMSWPSTPASRQDVMDAMAALGAFVLAHDLPLSAARFAPGSPSSRRFDRTTREWSRPVLPKIELWLRGSREMAAWCEALGVTEVRVQRRPGCDTCMWADTDQGGFTWSLAASYGLSLEAGDDVTWARDERTRRLTGHGVMTTAAVVALPEYDRVPS